MMGNHFHLLVKMLPGTDFSDKDVKQRFEHYYCLVYIGLNPVRAGIVEKPEDDRWNPIGYHVQTDNKDAFLSLDMD